MHTLATAVIQHTTDDGCHYDWLIEDPSLPDPHAPESKLWTARISAEPTGWCETRCMLIQVIPPHRRVYLSYQGEVSGRRGRVQRVARGVCRPAVWTQSRMVMHLDWGSCKQAADLRRLAIDRWVMTTPRAADHAM